MPLAGTDDRSLKILHVLRAPLGGLFRHVMDLAQEQVARGHRVGLVTDSIIGGERADMALRGLEPRLALGLSRVPMRRDPDIGDLAALAHVAGRIRRTMPDIVHGHGSKGGFYARAPGLMPRLGGGGHDPARAYTPHGGSFNYQPGTAQHRLYMMAERLLLRATDIMLFESAFIGRRFEQYIGRTDVLKRVVLNGIGPEEFTSIIPATDAADFLYIGELRSAKGIDTLIDAMSALQTANGLRTTAALVGSGPDESQLTAQATRLGLSDRIRFHGPLPVRQAFTLGRTMIVPSRAESLPYIVLEAAAAKIPLIATNVGGIPEIFGPYSDRLIVSNDVPALMEAMLAQMALSPECKKGRADELAAHVAERFTISRMVDAVLAGYREAIAAKAARAGIREKTLAVPS